MENTFTDIQQLTSFQLESLQDAANNPLGIDTYMLCEPNSAIDSEDVVRSWSKNNMETEQLVQWGLLTDISSEFEKEIQDNYAATKHSVRVFKLTRVAKDMFYQLKPSTTIN